VIKVRFVTDLGFETLRIAKNVTVYDEERGIIGNETKEERFFESRLE